METEEQLNEQIYMEINEQIFRDVAFSLNFDDDVYQQVLKDFGIKRLRYKMGGDEGIHSIVKDTEEDGNRGTS
jgi:hypothetical protein